MAGMPYGLQAMLKVRPPPQIATPSARFPFGAKTRRRAGAGFDPAPTPVARPPGTVRPSPRSMNARAACTRSMGR